MVPAVTPLLEADPEQVGRYRLRGRLGGGGMGVVFLGVPMDDDGAEPAAVKVIRPELAADPAFRARFAREIGAARRVESEFTAAVLDFDASPPQPWVAFQYVDGPTLAQVVESGPPRLTAAIGILAGVAEALHAIHRAGLTHRDLKPSNVLVPPAGVKVIDFGIAGVVDQTTVTLSGAMGTPAWLAPEQVRGGPVTPAADIFSWGLLATYVLTGRHAFGEGPAPALMYRIANERPDLSGVPPTLAATIGAALAAQPDERPRAEELLAATLPTAIASAATAPLAADTMSVVGMPPAIGLAAGAAPAAVTEVLVPPSARRRPRSVLFPLVAAVLAVIVAAAVYVASRPNSSKVGAGLLPGASATTGAPSTTAAPTTTAAPVAASLRAVLPPASVPPVVDECRAPTQVGADGNVAPLTCPNGDLNANAWQALATHDLSVMALGPGATAGEVLSAACADLAHTTKAVETSAIRLAAVYYGWGFTVDPACTPARKPPPDHHGHKGG